MADIERFSWTQPMCRLCWYAQFKGITDSPPNPVRLVDPEPEICVECGCRTQDGIYIRIDPTTAKYPTLAED